MRFYFFDIYAQKSLSDGVLWILFLSNLFLFPEEYLLKVSCYTGNNIPKSSHLL